MGVPKKAPCEKVCRTVRQIPRIHTDELSPERFTDDYFKCARPVIITGATDSWDLDCLEKRVGENTVWIRGQTNQEDYRLGKKYTIRKDTFGSYVRDLKANNARARSSYLAVGNMHQAFPQLLEELPLPSYLTHTGKLHNGPYLWVALAGHYEFCHFDPDDNFLVMIQGRKRVRLFGHDLRNLYPNALGSHGKTVQSRVNCDVPDLNKFPGFRDAVCEWCVLEPGEMLFIPAFYWHQVSALDSGISVNMFYGDPGEHAYSAKMLREPYRAHFEWWLLNIVEQNRACDSFQRMVPRLPEVVWHFFQKQWHEKPTQEVVEEVVRDIILKHLGLERLPESKDDSKFPPVLKIRGLLHRDDTKLNI